MPALSQEDRRRLESVVVRARVAAEGACGVVVSGLGVVEDRPPAHLGDEGRVLRRGLRERLRRLGGDVGLLVGECAYEQWHRLLFARFLAENGLLLHPEHWVPVTLAECEELAGDLGEPDGWAVAGRFAAQILPGIFRLDDPCVRLRLAPEGRVALEELLGELPAGVFRADDALGWVYQFWQKQKKDEVNASERKIGGADLGPVTQLFTENYMVRFLLENSLGAWWAARHPDSPLVSEWEFLRRGEDGSPAAGAFEEWPQQAAQVTVMDPCCGSGHFLVEAFAMLWRMRAEEERLDPIAAQDLVLAENLFGLELDPRCVEIAMFAVALAAWKAGGGWRELPVPQIACSGIPVKAPLEEWTALAQGDQRVELALTRLHRLFRDADTLGSLIDPRAAVSGGAQASTDDIDWEQIAPLLEQAASKEQADPAMAVLGADAASNAKAADLLSRTYTLITTNVPYLKTARQDPVLARFSATHYRDARHDLALTLTARGDQLVESGGTSALVLPQGWLFMAWSRRFRENRLKTSTWRLLARLGSGAFGAISGEVVSVVLGVFSAARPSASTQFGALDLQSVKGSEAKAQALRGARCRPVAQLAQLDHVDAKVIIDDVPQAPPLAAIAGGYAGICSGDYPRFGRKFWEVPLPRAGWVFQQSTVTSTRLYGGREHVFFWEDGDGEFFRSVSERLGKGNEGAWIRGVGFGGRRGVAVSSMGSLPVTLYTGEVFDNNTAVILPERDSDLPAIWAFACSAEFERLVRAFDASMKVTNASFVGVPFERSRWDAVAEREFPDGLPEPWSDDPTQWLFEGRPEVSTEPLQVAVARLVGYRWPEQAGSEELDELADADGIVCLPVVAGEAAAAERVRGVLARAFGDAWSPSKLDELLAGVGASGKSLDVWLRDEFFKQHCRVFANRPFVWHVWDGRKDGFSALVNYHRLDHALLQKLTFTYLGQDWLERQKADMEAGIAGAQERVAAAEDLRRRLELILAGEPPYDVYVRWKSLAEQPIGWDPDLDDGVRLNVRPFVEAGVLRSKFSVHWKKDRGKNHDGSERHNDLHYTTAEKRQARETHGHP